MNNSSETSLKELMHDRGICIVIPTYNNVGTIDAVVGRAQQYCNDVIVVNDGSTDGTAEKLRQMNGIVLIDYNENRGKGNALKRAFKKALNSGFSYAVTMDADGQHYASDICKFVRANMDYPGSLIVGIRDLRGVVRSKGSSFANKFSNFWFFIQTGRRLCDTQTGYRLYPLKKLYWLSLLTPRYEAELELLVFASWHGIKLHTIPVNVYYPPIKERVSHFRPVADFARISVLNTVLCVLAVIYGLPCRLFRILANAVRTTYSLLFFVVFSLFIISPAVWIYLHVGKVTDKKRTNLHKLIYHIARFVTIHHGIPGTRFTCSGTENVDFDKPSVVICNHQSHLDLICMLTLTPDLIFLTKDWVWNNPFYGLIIRNADFLPITNGVDEILPHLRSLRDRGYSIGVYPEGTRSVDCRIGRFHKGAFYIAERLGMDIQPIVIYGMGKVLPKKGYSFRKGVLHVEIMPRFKREKLDKIGNALEQAKYFRHYYINEYLKLCNREEQDA